MALEDFEKALAAEQTQRKRHDKHKASHRHKDRREHKDRKSHRDESRQSEPRETSQTHNLPEQARKRQRRDAWMEAPSALDIDYKQAKKDEKPKPPQTSDLKIYDNDLNREHLLARQNGETVPETRPLVGYTFGDAGSGWRMTKLKGILRRAAEENRDVEDLALEQYGDLQTFDEAREEQLELERQATYGKGYRMPEKPTGRLFRDRHPPEETDSRDPEMPVKTPVDLNRLRANLLKATARKDPNLAALQREYDMAAKPADVVLSAMDNRMLAGQRGEVAAVTNRRGRERGQVEENADMSIEDMVREERRTKGQAGGEARRFAERIAKDSKFGDSLDYMDENADKLAKRVHKSEINLKNTAISEFQKVNRILDECPLCHHEDTGQGPVAPVVSLATRTYLTLPSEPEVSEGGAMIVPIQHRQNLLECDDDEWEEVRNFMKSLTRLYHERGQDVLFYENAAAPHRRQHAALCAVALPKDVGGLAPAFFKEAILTAEDEWSQHRKLIDTSAKARDGWGKAAFRKSLVKEMPYFHVWFELDGGLGHIVEDGARWPKGDLFAREVIGGMLDADPATIKRQGRWTRAPDARLETFRRRWRPFDWTRIL